MGEQDKDTPQTGREIFEASDSGAEDRPFIPKLRSDTLPRRPPRTLSEFREEEGRDNRKARLKALWKQLPVLHHDAAKQAAQRLITMYDKELLRKCGGHSSSTSPMGRIPWKEFREYAEAKETELWQIFHDELDLDGNGRLEAQELSLALTKVGITLSTAKLGEFMTFLTASPHSHSVSFAEFRDFLLLLPQKASAAEIYRYYEMRKYLGEDARGATRVTMEGDVSLSAEDRPTITLKAEPSVKLKLEPSDAQDAHELDEGHSEELSDDEEDHHGFLEGHTAMKFLLAGGIAGAVSRTCTAPFDRLKIFLITRPPDLGGAPVTPKPSIGGAKIIASACVRIYSEGGVLAFWTGNGLSVAKIFPESAIKFFAYESSKRAFARYWDNVDDSRDISGVSRFLSGGIGGISSQLSNAATQMMSNAGQPRQADLAKGGVGLLKKQIQPKILIAARNLWALGGVRAYYRGLTIGLVGVFPYSAIDMSTFEALKLAYLRSTGKDEPGVLALLAFGSISGSVGATSVYPLNLVRTRLQASGSSGHPQKYTGVWDVAGKTWERDGWRGFYRGLFPTLAKVVPAVSISYVVYEHSKRRCGPLIDLTNFFFDIATDLGCKLVTRLPLMAYFFFDCCCMYS
ncbi:mitochondrial carrier domain-containing protein [Mycena rosella]|uniref:Mitochondrial carrier domain-containing protein n=1 Tax=Mycena rosella TaxID=1033263 RepID=A0AAD7DXE2_MYCRO|nr:mitochondrial carrier domain-containing protein [Mycena rosella]